MAKLVLKSVMWGVDKVPDTWFDKVPGPYYKAKDENGKVIKQQIQGKNQEAYDDMKQKRSSHRRSEDYDRGRGDDYDDGYRSDGHGQRSGQRKSRHGNYDLANDRPRRERSRPDQYRGEKKRTNEQRPDDRRMDGLYSYHDGPVVPPVNGAAVAAAAAGGAAAGRGPSGPYAPSDASQSQPYSPQPGYRPTATSTLRGGMATGYVPYADIYGGAVQQPSSYAPSSSDMGSVQPTYMNQVARPVAKQPYHQNPYAQEAPAGINQPGFIPDPNSYDDREPDDRRGDRSNTDYDGDGSETERRYSRSRSQKHRSHRDDYSPSEDSYDSRRDSRRSKSERRDRRDTEKPSARGKSGPLREVFDTSQRGLGYSAVGALAGGLVGSEIGKGALSTGVGAALGALASNAFQARERKYVVNPL